MYQVSTYFVNIATMTAQCYVQWNFLDSLLAECCIARYLIWRWRSSVPVKLVANTTKKVISITDNNLFNCFRPMRANLVVNTDIWEALTGLGFNSIYKYQSHPNNKNLSHVFILRTLHLFVWTILAFFNLNNLCFLVLVASMRVSNYQTLFKTIFFAWTFV
jgi:hypothetical protein